METVGSTGEEGAGMVDVARGQRYAPGVSVFVLFWSDSEWFSGLLFFFCLCKVDTFANTKTCNLITGNGCINI